MRKDKLSDYLIDVSKYVLTGVVIASIFEDMENSKLAVYLLGLLVSASTLIAGLLLGNNKKEEEK